jgi:hypothetical protein
MNVANYFITLEKKTPYEKKIKSLALAFFFQQ